VKFENICSISVACPTLWDFLTDIPKVATCLPGVEEVNALEGGKYSGVITLKVGAVKLRLSGKISVELMDQEKRSAIMAVEAKDQKISGMIQGKLTMRLDEQGPAQTKLTAGTDINLFGKIGEFGQPIIKKKADQMMEEFANNLAARVGGNRVTAPASILNLS
jgi:uncharacterized protein